MNPQLLTTALLLPHQSLGSCPKQHNSTVNPTNHDLPENACYLVRQCCLQPKMLSGEVVGEQYGKSKMWKGHYLHFNKYTLAIFIH